MNLSWRLIISFAVVILITLTLAFITLILVARPLQNRLVIIRLTAQSRVAAGQIDNLYRQGVSTADIVARLNDRPADSTPRLIFIDPQGTVLADTGAALNGQQLPLSMPIDETGQSGTLRPPGGQLLNYAAQPVGPGDNLAGYVVVAVPRTPAIPRLITELGWGFAVAGFVALLAALLASVVIARSIAGPLQTIARGAAAVAAGDYAQRIPEKGPPEIRRVATSFNVMAGRVEASQKAMRDFVSNVSHELKTPLTSIQGFSQAIMEGATHDEAARQRAARIIHEEAARMSRMVEDLLDLARIDSGQVVMQKTPLELEQILSSTFDRLLTQAEQKDVTLVKDWGSLPTIVGDGDRLAQVFTNLLDNAIRHTPAGGRVTLGSKLVRSIPRPRHVRPELVEQDVTTTLSERGDFVEISISDTGPGIPPQDLARIFERFYQVDKSRKRGKGTGLGLAIIKEIIDAHGGYIRAESVEGLGTKFIVLLPITEADALTLISSRSP